MSADVNEKRGRRRRRTEEEIAANAAAGIEAEEMEEDDTEDEGMLSERAITAPKGRPTAGRRNRQQVEEPEGNVVTRPVNGFMEYLDGVRSELEKVSWPTRPEVIRLMQVVLAVTVGSSLALGAIALIFTTLFANGLENPIIFVIFFIVAGIAAYAVYRNMQNQGDSDNYNYPNRL